MSESYLGTGPNKSNWPVARYLGSQLAGQTWTINGRDYNFANNDMQRVQPVHPDDIDQLLQRGGFVQVSAGGNTDEAQTEAVSTDGQTGESDTTGTQTFTSEASKPARPTKKGSINTTGEVVPNANTADVVIPPPDGETVVAPTDQEPEKES